MRCYAEALIDTQTCQIESFDKKLSPTQRLTAFKCLLYSKNANKNTLLEHYYMLKQPTFDILHLVVDLNRI